MKVFFDTNMYIAEALLGHVATQMIEATVQAGWRIYASLYLLDELNRVRFRSCPLLLSKYECGR